MMTMGAHFKAPGKAHRRDIDAVQYRKVFWPKVQTFQTRILDIVHKWLQVYFFIMMSNLGRMARKYFAEIY
jgi:hypothetical protein